jgi:hypothetical protein
MMKKSDRYRFTAEQIAAMNVEGIQRAATAALHVMAKFIAYERERVAAATLAEVMEAMDRIRGECCAKENLTEDEGTLVGRIITDTLEEQGMDDLLGEYKQQRSLN